MRWSFLDSVCAGSLQSSACCLGLGISAHYRITTSLLVGAMFVVWRA